MKLNNTIEQWYQSWADKPAARRALDLLSQVGGAEEDLAMTRWRILRACYNAAHYDPERDPGKKYRDELVAMKKSISSISRAARVLKLAAASKHRGLMWAMAIADQESGVRLTRREPEGQVEVLSLAERYFKSLETALEGKLPEFSGGPFLHKSTIGNLFFERHLHSGRPIEVSTMLAFELSLYLRKHTSGHANDIQTAEAMPTDGNPSYPVVAAFCEAALDSTLDAKQVGDKVRQLKDTTLMRWPTGD